MTPIDRFLQDITHRIAPGMPGVSRLEADLGSHLRQRVEAGEEERAAVARMGDPAEVVAEFLEAARPPIAGPWKRLGAFLFDVGLGAAAFAAVAVPAAWLLGTASQRQPLAPGPAVAIETALIGTAILLFLAALLYFPVFEALFGQTAGKRVYGIVVAREGGGRVGLGAALVRRIPFAFDIWPFDAAFLLFTARRQRAFDLVAKTIVFRAEGRHPARPWLLVLLVWMVAAALALLAALAGGAFEG
jgi:uncharacterized RDD family membrane protein YckC